MVCIKFLIRSRCCTCIFCRFFSHCFPAITQLSILISQAFFDTLWCFCYVRFGDLLSTVAQNLWLMVGFYKHVSGTFLSCSILPFNDESVLLSDWTPT